MTTAGKKREKKTEDGYQILETRSDEKQKQMFNFKNTKTKKLE